MPSVKIPLFNGLVQPFHVPSGAVEIFVPPDFKSATPQTYEVHLWMVPNSWSDGDANNALSVSIVASEGVLGSTSNTGALWFGQPFNGKKSTFPIKVLDGVPVRGDTRLLLVADAVGATDLYPKGLQLWGYYYVSGQGAQFEPQRRFIGKSLGGFNQGVPFDFSLPAGVGKAQTAKQIIHTFEPGKIDDIALTFDAIYPGDPTDVVFSFTFEDSNGVPLIDPDHDLGVLTPMLGACTSPSFEGGVNANPSRMQVKLDPYIIRGVFGGSVGPSRLSQISARMLRSSSADLIQGFVHGYFTRH